VALLLRAKGITRVRPLEGGIDAWRADSLPFVPTASSRKPMTLRKYFRSAGAAKNPQCQDTTLMPYLCSFLYAGFR